jgi:hypothetical protein
MFPNKEACEHRSTWLGTKTATLEFLATGQRLALRCSLDRQGERRNVALIHTQGHSRRVFETQPGMIAHSPTWQLCMSDASKQ